MQETEECSSKLARHRTMQPSPRQSKNPVRPTHRSSPSGPRWQSSDRHLARPLVRSDAPLRLHPIPLERGQSLALAHLAHSCQFGGHARWSPLAPRIRQTHQATHEYLVFPRGAPSKRGTRAREAQDGRNALKRRCISRVYGFSVTFLRHPAPRSAPTKAHASQC